MKLKLGEWGVCKKHGIQRIHRWWGGLCTACMMEWSYKDKVSIPAGEWI